MNWIRKALKGFSLTAAMFVFQACYGTMQDYYDTPVTFRVVSDDTREPMADVQIWSQIINGDSTECSSPLLTDYTGADGMATIWTSNGLERFIVIDNDSLYEPVEIVIDATSTDTVDIVLKKAL